MYQTVIILSTKIYDLKLYAKVRLCDCCDADIVVKNNYEE